MLYSEKNIARKLLNDRLSEWGMLHAIRMRVAPTDGLPDIRQFSDKYNACLDVTIMAIKTVWPARQVTVHDVLWFLSLKNLLALNAITQRRTCLDEYLSSLPGMSARTGRPVWFRWTEFWHNRKTGTGLLYRIDSRLRKGTNKPHSPVDMARDILVYFPEKENCPELFWFNKINHHEIIPAHSGIKQSSIC